MLIFINLAIVAIRRLGIFFVVPLKLYMRTVVVQLFEKVEQPVVLNYGGAFARAISSCSSDALFSYKSQQFKRGYDC